MRRLAAMFLAALGVALVCQAASPAPKSAPKSAPKTAQKSSGKSPSKAAPKAAPKTAPKAAPKYSNAYASRRTKERPLRKQTRFIILHTTEGERDGALAKLSANGECHYVVDRAGVIYRIVDRRKVAFHCGRSMWNNVKDLDNCAVGIEIVGYHNRELTAAQYASLKYLLADLKRIYKITDDRVLTHSMVAYGTPNRWQKRSHRGRKRCAMLLADPARRRRLGLFSKPAYDPDLRAGRLADADPELTRILYGTGAATPAPVKPAPAALAKPVASTPAKPVSAKPAPAAPAKPAASAPAKPPASPPKPSATPPAKPAPSATAKPAAAKPAPVAPPAPAASSGDNVIGPRRSAWDIARDQYNAASTLYTFPDGTKKKGSEITNWKALPAGTVVQVGAGEENAPDAPEILGRDGGSIRELAGDEARAASTFYFPPGAKSYSRGSALTDAQIDAFPEGTRVLVGYAVGGPVSARKRMFDICGVRWNRPETYYFTPKGQLLPGDKVNERALPVGTWVFYEE